MSANILREIVASVIKCDAREIRLSGILNPETKWKEDSGHSWDENASQDYYKVWGFNPKDGLKMLNISMQSAYSENGSVINSGHSESLEEYLLRTKESYIFYVVNHSGRHYGKDGEEFDFLTIYKSPDFKKYWEKINMDDIARWEKWLKEEVKN